MSEFFSNYPKIVYDIKGTNSTNPNYTVAINLMIRNKLRDAVEKDVITYYPYIVPEGMRPDVLSYQYYGDVAYTWTIFLVNNILDPYWGWPLNYKDFRGYMITKYGSIEKSQITVHRYEQIARSRVEQSRVQDPVPEYKIEIDYETYTNTNIEERDILYKFEWERDLNDNKREIQLIDRSYISNVLDEARRLFR
jgi:hypothetical protein